ncbi:MAG: hypothetical protein HQM14_00445 [SAR324 cluster bacterium]|nr:hypothetical protein [SAR324 cluster bacterium]
MSASTQTTASAESKSGDISTVDPSKGLPAAEIRMDDLSSIPGLLPHWKGEIQKRRKEILALREVSFLKRAKQLLKAGSGSDTVTGMEVLRILDAKSKENKSTKALQTDPVNCDERAHLISYILKRTTSLGRELNLLEMRALLLQAFIANSFEERSLNSLLALYQTHVAYLELAIKRNEITISEMKANHDPKEVQQKTQLNKNMLSAYRNFIVRRIQKILPQIKKLHIDNNRLRKFDTGQENAAQKKTFMMRSAYYAVYIMRCFPSLKKETMEIVDLVMKLDPSDPLGPFLKGHVLAAEGELKFDQERAGFRTKNIKGEMVRSIKESLENYGQAISKIPGNRYEGLNYNILAEYINFLIFVCKFIQAPVAWKKTYLNKAMGTLERSDSKNGEKIIAMQNRIQALLDTMY